jgi:hypothetical protein
MRDAIHIELRVLFDDEDQAQRPRQHGPRGASVYRALHLLETRDASGHRHVQHAYRLVSATNSRESGIEVERGPSGQIHELPPPRRQFCFAIQSRELFVAKGEHLPSGHRSTA